MARSRVHLEAAAVSPQTEAAVFQLRTGMDPITWYGSSMDAPVSRAEALSVPACMRALNLVTTTVAGLPLERITPDAVRMDLGWLEQPEADRPRFKTFNDTLLDLYMDGRAYWRITQRLADGSPAMGGVEYLPLDRIGEGPTKDHPLTVDGKPIPARDVVGFHGWHDGIRRHGARILRTALALEKAAKRYADTPMPSTILRNTSTYELDDAEIDALIAGVKKHRNEEAIGYINAGLEVEEVGWNSRDMQLVEARQFTASQIANLVGVPAGLVAGANTSGSSLTYQSVTQENRGLIDFGLTPAIKTLEARLSMSDVMGKAWTNQVTPRGTVVRFNVNALMRGNPLERAQVYTQLIPLGVLTVEEARAMEDLTPEGRQQA